MTRGREVRYGDGAIRQVPRLVAERAARRVLLICGQRSFEASGAARLLPGLEQVAQVSRWSGFTPNPDVADLLRGLRLAGEFRPDLVLAVGGGSAMDLGKLVCAFEDHTDPDALAVAVRSGERVKARRLGLILAPTTSGSGSEATHFAVVYTGDVKHSVTGDVLRPDAAVLDPSLTLSGSRYQRASSGIDAVAQAIESLWAVGATAQSRRWARHALRLLLPAIEPYVNQPNPVAARAMAIGSHLAGRAIDISRTTAAHALSYAITKRYGISHGHAVALTLGAFLEGHDQADPERLRVDPVAHAMIMEEICGRLAAPDGRGARRRWEALMRSLGLAPGLTSAGAGTSADRRALAEAVNADRLRNNPVTYPSADLGTFVLELS